MNEFLAELRMDLAWFCDPSSAIWADPRYEIARPFVVRIRTRCHSRLNIRPTACQLRADSSSSLVHIRTPIRTPCPDDLTGIMQILHSLPRGQPRLPLAMVLTPPAASAHHPSQQDDHTQPCHFPTCTACPAPLAGTPHPLRPAGSSAAGLRLLDPARTP